jgi:hypothetical protein
VHVLDCFLQFSSFHFHDDHAPPMAAALGLISFKIMVIVHHEARKAEVPFGDLARSLTLALYAASARNLALTGPSCRGRKPACEASVAIALVLLKPGNFCRALAVKLA